MIKVLFLIPNLGHGGAEKVLVNLVNHMDRAKFQITVMALYDEGVNRASLSSHIEYKACFKRSFIGVSHFLKLFSPEQLYKRIIHENYDIVVSYLEGQTARIVSGCRDKDTKLVSWIHVEQHTAKNASRTFRSEKEMKQCYHKFNQTVCVSQFVMQDFLSIVAVKNCMVLYNTVESERIRTLADEVVEDVVFSKDEYNICSVGTLKPSKGYDRLIRVHDRLWKEGFPIHTYILGEGPEEKKLKSLVESLGHKETVSFLGYQINPYKYIKKCDLLTCSSFAEGFSTAATEALIVGTPVCTVEVSGMKEMLGENNEYGVVTENNEDALYLGVKSLLRDPKQLAYYKMKAIQRGKAFSTENTVEKVENMLTHIMDDNHD